MSWKENLQLSDLLVISRLKSPAVFAAMVAMNGPNNCWRKMSGTIYT